MQVAGIYSSHDCSFAVLDEGVVIAHLELERFARVKEPTEDGFKFYENYWAGPKTINHFTEVCDTWKENYAENRKNMFKICEDGGGYHEAGHHQAHAANAFFSSNFDDALIITIDGGGMDRRDDGSQMITAFTVWEGKGNKIEKVEILEERMSNVGFTWTNATKYIFGLSTGYPKGAQMGTVMAMAAFGEPKYLDRFVDIVRDTELGVKNPSCMVPFAHLAGESEQGAFDVAASLQLATEVVMKELMGKYVSKTSSRNLCLSGGVVLNSSMTGKMFDWFKDKIDNIYVCPVPYDSGLAIGSAQYYWHHVLGNERVRWKDNASPYLGYVYQENVITNELMNFKDEVVWEKCSDDDVLDKLANQNIISVYGGGSESGRRALGNRSILADPRSPNMKALINEKVKHRQWFRPFAPSILREDVGEWFEKDIDSPYMSFCVKFKEEMKSKVPAVLHEDGTARLQTVTENDNRWYYNFIKKWKEKSGVPIVLNTSFNDTEPIVEVPEHAIKCFLKTNIDYLYFFDYNILVKKK